MEQKLKMFGVAVLIFLPLDAGTLWLFDWLGWRTGWTDMLTAGTAGYVGSVASRCLCWARQSGCERTTLIAALSPLRLSRSCSGCAETEDRRGRQRIRSKALRKAGPAA